MQESAYEFYFHFNIPDEDTVNRINAVLAAQKYSELKISHVKPTVVKETHYKPDGTVHFKRETVGISDISFSGEMEEHHVGYDYRLYITLLSHRMDRGLEDFREGWNSLHLYSTMRQLFQYEFEEGYVYVVLYHDGRSEDAEPEPQNSNSSLFEDFSDDDFKYDGVCLTVWLED
jgi:hypothetical protein